MSQLQSLRPDWAKEKAWRRWNRELDRMFPEEGKHNVPGFKRFVPYTPDMAGFSPDCLTSFRGVYVTNDQMCWPYKSIEMCTRSNSDGNSEIFGLCDNASQVVELYNALFCGAEYGDKNKPTLEWFESRREMAENVKSQGWYGKRCRAYWKGNHVIILNKLRDFRWHKWGPYIGDFSPRHEYFSDEEGIDFVYAFNVYKVW